MMDFNTLNKNFYSRNAESFSNTRAVVWAGWDKLFEHIAPPDSVLDVGCGNGRFFKAVKQVNSEIEYLGVDSSTELIEIARKNFEGEQNVSFQIIDLMETNWTARILEKYDLVVAFGVLHHVEGYENRLSLIKQLLDLKAQGGFVAVTLWQFMKSGRQIKSILKDLGGNDYILDWNNSGEQRFCHYFDDKEIEQIKNEVVGEGFKLVGEYNADGKEGDLNRYLIFSN